MAIKLIEFPSPDGMSEHVCVAVEDFADDQQVKMVLDEACAILAKAPGAAREWRRESDCCYRVTGGILRKNGGRKALDKVAKALDELGYGDFIERVVSEKKP